MSKVSNEHLISAARATADHLVKDADVARLNAAESLRYAKHCLDWKKTEYGSFRGFVEKEVAMSYSRACGEICTITLLKRLFPKIAQACEVVNTIGWARMAIGVRSAVTYDLTFKNSAEFINEFKDLSLNARSAERSGGSTAYRFELGEAAADRLEFALKAHGMRTNGKYRIGASIAMENLIAEVLKDY